MPVSAAARQRQPLATVPGRLVRFRHAGQLCTTPDLPRAIAYDMTQGRVAYVTRITLSEGFAAAAGHPSKCSPGGRLTRPLRVAHEHTNSLPRRAASNLESRLDVAFAGMGQTSEHNHAFMGLVAYRAVWARRGIVADGTTMHRHSRHGTLHFQRRQSLLSCFHGMPPTNRAALAHHSTLPQRSTTDHCT